VYSLERRRRAVEPCIEYGLKATAAIREPGYPSRAQLAGWHGEWQESGGGLTDRSLGQHAPEQKRAAARHRPAHGGRDALARREPGCPKCAARLAERAVYSLT
jgi:transposase-like protein